MTIDFPPLTPALEAALDRITERGLSPMACGLHVGLLLVSTGMTIVIASLLATEPALPIRTSAAFGAMLMIGVAWSVYSIVVLRYRRVLLIGHRVVAAGMGLAFSALFVIGSLVAGAMSGAAAGYLAAGVGTLWVLAAAMLLKRALREREQLVARCGAMQPGAMQPGAMHPAKVSETQLH